MISKDQALRVMNHVDPALIEWADTPRSRRIPRAVRTVLVAACVCLVLAGTALAAGYIAGNFRAMRPSEREFIVAPLSGEGQTLTGYTLLGGTIRFFSPELLSDSARKIASDQGANTAFLGFRDLEEAQEFYQLSLPVNPVLDNFPLSYCASTMDSSDEGVTRITLTQTYRNVEGINGLTLRVEITALTELMESADREMWFKYGYPAQYDCSLSEYRSGSMTAIVAHVQYMGSGQSPWQLYGNDCYSAHFILDGMVYRVLLTCGEATPQAQPLLESVLAGYGS